MSIVPISMKLLHIFGISNIRSYLTALLCGTCIPTIVRRQYTHVGAQNRCVHEQKSIHSNVFFRRSKSAELFRQTD